jgi:plasmid maintenance system antidote protein VapI
MQVHPGKKIQEELKNRGWTQRQFAFLLWKKVSELNELIKWKRNVTVHRDILLSHVLWTSRKYWLDLQNEYEYSLIEADFDISKLPKPEDKHWSISINVDKKSDKKDHKVSEQEVKIENLNSDRKISSSEWQESGKKDIKPASNRDDNLNKEHKIISHVDKSSRQEKLSEKHRQKDEIEKEKVQENQKNPDSEKSHHKHKEHIFRNF